jgi:cell division protein FtsQ
MKKKKLKKPNIPLRRKIAVAYSRLTILLKLSIVLFLYLLFFTKYLDSQKQKIAEGIYEFTADIGFSLENVLIEGQYNSFSDDIISALNADIGTPIMSIDLLKVKARLEKNTWVKMAVVERRMPKTIYIGLVERAPIAIWQNNQKLYLIDDEGNKITNAMQKFSHLLHVVGPDANIYAHKLIYTLSKYPEFAGKVVSAVRYGNRRWNLNLLQNITIKMPEMGFEKALDYIIKLYEAGKLFDQGYKILDLRDPTKYYITSLYPVYPYYYAKELFSLASHP